MAQAFTLQLQNPAITNEPTDIIYTGLTNGNKLNLVITNNSGFDLSFDGSAELLVKISKEVLDDTSAGAITAAAPWTVSGIYTPTNDPDSGDNQKYYVVRLSIASPPLDFSNNGSITVALATINPVATGTAAVMLYYDFGVTMNPASQLSVLSSGNTGKILIGPNQSLLYTLMVNDGNETNSVVATATNVPVTPANAAENVIHLNLFFLNPDTGGTQGSMGQLVPSWDPSHPPTFKLRFPYFSGNSPDPAYADLTDDFKTGDSNYNQYTSAWNIKLSLDKDNPNITSNNWWKIIPPDPGAPSPYWLIQPTTANKYLFTGTYTGANASGPFLDLYFSHIYSNLPVSTNNPETQIILETYKFPAFNDNVWPRPLFKENSVQILSFAGSVQYTPSAGTTLTLTWGTTGDHCFISGDSTQQGPNASGKAYSKLISNSNPLLSSYTLTAYDKQGVSKISRTINVKWKADNGNVFPVSSGYSTPTGFDLSPTADKVYIAGGISNDIGSIAVATLDGKTLVESPNPIILPDNQIAQNVIASPDGTKIMVAGLTFTGDSGKIYGFTTSNPPTMITGSPLNVSANSLPNLYPMAISDDSTQLLISAPFTSGVDPFVEGISTSTIKVSPASGNPAAISGLGAIGLATVGNNVFCPIIDGTVTGGLGVLNRTTLAQVTGSPISLRSDPSGVKYTAGPMLVSSDGNTVTSLAQGYDVTNNAQLFILCQVDIPSMKLTRRLQSYNGYSNAAPTPMTSLVYSTDEQYIFVCGQDYSPNSPNNYASLVSVYDAVTLKELPWSPVATPLLADGLTNSFVVDMKMAPDGSRIYALTLNSDISTTTDGVVRAFIPYF